jgi:hypothetical protein
MREGTRRFGPRAAALVLALVAAANRSPALAPAQVPARPPQREGTGVAITNAGIGRYEALYGTPEDVPLEEVLGMLARGEAFRTAIRTRGRFDDQDTSYSLCEGRRCLKAIQPVAEIQHEFDTQAASFRSRELEVVGVFEGGRFTFWSYSLATAEDARPRGPGGSAIQELVNRKTPFENKDVTVRGQFRGGNLYGDLPAGSGATTADWVISDGPFSVWVTGKAPRGKGFSLNPASRADCVFWLEVQGRPARLGEVVVLKAGRILFLGRSPKGPDPR